MHFRSSVVLVAALLICLIPAAGQALEAYSQNFEDLVQTDINALANDGWIVYGNVSTPDGTYLYGYGPFQAPNDGFAFSQIVILEGGDDQGFQQLVVFSDYNNADHAAGNIIESNVFHEQTIEAADVDHAWSFDFQAKLGNIESPSTATAFIKTLDPDNGYAITNFIPVDMTEIPETWGGYSLSITIDSSLEGQLLQFGFMNTATLYQSSGIFYDNVIFQDQGPVGVPDASAAYGATLHQNYPNPFNPLTRIDFALEQAETIEISVFDLAGRRVASLFQGELTAGDHHVIWDGKTDTGQPAPTGQYRYALKTSAGQVSRSMVLVK